MDFLTNTYNALRTPQGAPQSPSDTIGRLADRLSPSTLLADRRASVLALKGLAREWRVEVSDNALPGLLGVLENDAEIDADIAKAVLETFIVLCDVGDASPPAEIRALALRNSDAVLKTPTPIQKLFNLLTDPVFYVRYSSLQFLGILLHNRRQLVQTYFLSTQTAPAALLSVLEDKREITRNEALSTLQSLLVQSPDIQKIFAFEGAFEKLFAIVRRENGVDGGILVHDCLACVDGLLRLNNANQTFFRETGFASFLTSLLYFPSNLPPQEPAPQEFYLQFWDPQKIKNVGLLVGILGILVASKAGNELEHVNFVRILLEMALVSNAPTVLKTQALALLPANLTFPLISYSVTPYVPVPETNDEEWDRLEAVYALDVLIEQILQGEYSGAEVSRRKGKEALRLRASGISVFENYVRKEEIRLTILKSMFPSDAHPIQPSTLLQCLTQPPPSPLDTNTILSTHLATILFASLLRTSFQCKELARSIAPSSLGPAESNPPSSSGNFFIPAKGLPPPPPSSARASARDDEDEEPPQSLLALLTEHLSLSFLSRAHAASSETERETREWDRLIVAYLALLSQWLWEEPRGVREFLENGGMGMLVEPINQTNDVDPLVQGLCAFLLGVCYEYNREPGEITRAKIHAIFNRLSVDALIGRMARVREDERFKAVGPEDIIIPCRSPAQSSSAAATASPAQHHQDEGEIWFDWAFVDFWKSNYYTVQRAMALDPDTLGSSSSNAAAEQAMVIASLRAEVRRQAEEMDALRLAGASRAEHLEAELLRERVARASKEAEDARRIEALEVQFQQSQSQAQSQQREKEKEETLEARVTALTSELAALRAVRAEAEKEQEDLLIFLEEVSAKRRRDKARLRALGAGGVSDDEEGEGEE